MNLNNCHNQVMVRRQNRFKRTFFKALILSLALALGLLALTACLGQNVAEPGLTRPPTDRAEEEIPVIRQDRVMSEEEAEFFARRLNSPLENYDLIRPGGARNLGDLEKVRIERVVDGDTLIVLRQDQPVRLRLIGIDALTGSWNALREGGFEPLRFLIDFAPDLLAGVLMTALGNQMKYDLSLIVSFIFAYRIFRNINYITRKFYIRLRAARHRRKGGGEGLPQESGEDFI